MILQGKYKSYIDVVFLSLISAGNVLGRYCGNTLPDAVDTSDSFAYVKFVTDGSVRAGGFRLRFDSSTEGWVCKAQVTFRESAQSTG